VIIKMIAKLWCNGIRLSTHVFNTEADVDAALAAIRGELASPAIEPASPASAPSRIAGEYDRHQLTDLSASRSSDKHSWSDPAVEERTRHATSRPPVGSLEAPRRGS
jgi:hypothetical protein